MLWAGLISVCARLPNSGQKKGLKMPETRQEKGRVLREGTMCRRYEGRQTGYRFVPDKGHLKSTEETEE